MLFWFTYAIYALHHMSREIIQDPFPVVIKFS